MDDEVKDEVTLEQALADEFDKQTQEEPEKELEAAAEEAEEVEEVAPPEHWSDEDKQAFVAMDESGREWALRLESNFHKGIEEKSKELKKFRDAIEPYKHLVPPGVAEEQVVQQLLNAQAYLQQNPVEGIKWLMQSYGVDEKQFAPAETPVEDDLYIDPQVKALQDQIAELKRSNESSLQKAESERQRAYFAQIQSFKDETDDNGELLHPHFQAVSPVMSGLLTSGRAQTMEDAYQQAVWAVPEYREAEVERKIREHAEKQRQATQEAAEKAEKASKTVKGKQSANAAPKPRTMLDDLAENYEKSIRGDL
jgi:hypothetical protein